MLKRIQYIEFTSRVLVVRTKNHFRGKHYSLLNAKKRSKCLVLGHKEPYGCRVAHHIYLLKPCPVQLSMSCLGNSCFGPHSKLKKKSKLVVDNF